MILPYPARLLCLCLAAFFLVHLATGLVVVALARVAERAGDSLRSRAASRLLLVLRLLPFGCSLLVVAALCVPSYLWLEPESTAEKVGMACLATALLGAAVCGVSIARTVRACARSLRYARCCQRAGLKTEVPGESSPVWVVEGATGRLELAGIMRPRLFISSGVMHALSAGQLEAALRHEGAHRASRDNLKRLFILLAPGILPFFHGFETLERGWAKFAEWAADDRAVAGDARWSLSLAEALVRVARLGPTLRPSSVVTSLLDDVGHLAARVDRLLHGAGKRSESPVRSIAPAAILTATALLGFLIAIVGPATLYSVHRLLERLVH